MSRSWRRKVAIVFGVVLAAAACDPDAAGTASGNCRRLLRIVADLAGDDIAGPEELSARLDADIGEFRAGSLLRESFDRLTAHLDAGHGPGVADELAFLEPTCRDVTAGAG